jgi:hypothetical protein
MMLCYFREIVSVLKDWQNNATNGGDRPSHAQNCSVVTQPFQHLIASTTNMHFFPMHRQCGKCVVRKRWSWSVSNVDWRPAQNDALNPMLAGLKMGSFSMGDYYGWQLTASMGSRRLRHRRELISRLVHKAMLSTNETSLARPKAGRLPSECDDLLPHP